MTWNFLKLDHYLWTTTLIVRTLAYLFTYFLMDSNEICTSNFPLCALPACKLTFSQNVAYSYNMDNTTNDLY